jgi:hypothetical protein
MGAQAHPSGVAPVAPKEWLTPSRLLFFDRSRLIFGQTVGAFLRDLRGQPRALAQSNRSIEGCLDFLFIQPFVASM